MTNKTNKILKLLVIWFILSVSVLSSVVFGMIFLQKKSGEISFSLNTEIKKLSLLKGANTMLSETKEKREYLESLFVNKDSVIDFLEVIESLGKRTGAKITVISVSEDDKAFPVPGTKIFIPGNKIRLEILGSWSQIFKTFYLLDYVPATFSYQNISLAEGNEKSDIKSKQKTNWEASIEALILRSDKK